MNQQDHDKRSLDLHRLIAKKMRDNPIILQEAKERLERWIKTTATERMMVYLNAWNDAIQKGSEASILLMTEESDWATAMRQSSPFSCALTQEERELFLKDWKNKNETKSS